MVIRTFLTREIADKWNETFQIDVNGEFRAEESFRLLKCNTCELQFFLPTLPGSPSLYEKLDKFNWYYMKQKWEHDIAMQDFDGMESGVEVGCGFGDFVERVMREKPKVAFEGCEQNLSAVAKARTRGIPVNDVSCEELARSRQGAYAVCCAFQVLEHLPEPKSFLEAACKLLRSGGRLILGLPNAGGFLRYQFNILDMPPHHVSRWSLNTLRYIQAIFPLKIRHIAFEPLAEYHVRGYVEAYTGLLARRGLFVGTSPLLRAGLSKLLGTSAIRRHLRGHSIYACYERS